MLPKTKLKLKFLGTDLGFLFYKNPLSKLPIQLLIIDKNWANSRFGLPSLNLYYGVYFCYI